MIILKDEISSQENMEMWLSQLGQAGNRISEHGLVEQMRPRFISCDFEKREACIAFDVYDWELNPGGSLHGGITVTGFDMSCGLLCHYYAKQHAITTVNLTTTFLKPILPGDTIYYHAKITSLGRTLMSVTAEARLARGNILAATASVTFMKLDKTFAVPI